MKANNKPVIHLTEIFIKDKESYDEGFRLLTQFIVENRINERKVSA